MRVFLLARLLACGGLSVRLFASDPTSLLERTRAGALEYSHSLPDFICTEIVHRSIEMAKPKIRRPLDTLTFTVGYGPAGEQRKLMLVDDIPTAASDDTLGGLRNLGEFGAMLAAIFDPAAETRFEWTSSTTVRRHAAAIYAYQVDRSRSAYMLSQGIRKPCQSVVVGVRGMVTVDRKTGQVLQLVYQATDIPENFPLQYSSTTVDYDFISTAGKRYQLPVRSETEIRTGVFKARNSVEFFNYRKFIADSTVHFDDPMR